MEPSKKNKSSSYKAYAKYSGLAIQMGLTIGFFAWLGTYIDGYYQMQKPLFTIILSLFGIFMSLYVVLKGVMKRDDS